MLYFTMLCPCYATVFVGSVHLLYLCIIKDAVRYRISQEYRQLAAYNMQLFVYPLTRSNLQPAVCTLLCVAGNIILTYLPIHLPAYPPTRQPAYQPSTYLLHYELHTHLQVSLHLALFL